MSIGREVFTDIASKTKDKTVEIAKKAGSGFMSFMKKAGTAITNALLDN